jgi:uncharacterized protein (TIGR04376 family)
MGLFDDFSKFLEMRLEEFLRNNPHLELEALLEQLKEQKQDTIKLIAQLKLEEKKLESQILSVAKDIQIWHGRISKARAGGRLDLAEAAQEREAALLRQGNLLWGQRDGVKKRLAQAGQLLAQIEQREKEVQAQAAQVKAQQNYSPNNWNNIGWHEGVNYSNYNRSFDPLEEQFQRWETDEELEQMKRNLNR